MFPKIYEKSGINKDIISENDYDLIVKTIKEFDSSNFFTDHLDKDQGGQKAIVSKFQKSLLSTLQSTIPNIDWRMEHKPNDIARDSIDIMGLTDKLNVVIELDKHRADQVAKKFLSRLAILSESNIFYIALCYPGTSRMNPNECIKYFKYCTILSKKIGHMFIGLIIE